MRRIAARLLWALAVVWAVTTIAFFVNNLLPTDPARMVAGAQARPADIARIRYQLGLDKSAAVQYALFMRRLVHKGQRELSDHDPKHQGCASIGPIHIDLGMSYQQHRPVLAILADKLPRTIYLAGAAIVVQLVIGLILGVLAGARHGTRIDDAAVGVSLLGISAPTFLLGIGLQFVFAHKLRLLPLDGYGQSNAEHFQSIILPSLTLGIFGAAYYTRLIRDQVKEQLAEDYVRTARAKGASQTRAVLMHALRNALIPIVTLAWMDLGTLLGGAIVTESLFRWPGIGQLSVNALFDRDSPIILGTVIVTSTAMVLANLMADICYAWIDPRVRRAR